MTWIGWVATWLCTASVAVLTLFGLHRASLIVPWRRKGNDRQAPPAPHNDVLPVVTVQLPLFNEPAVARRVIEAACALDWPPDRLQIQVLDDSTDETRFVVDRAVSEARARGVDICVQRRELRVGFKAGALGAGLLHARGELVAIFDADFIPQQSFLRSLVPELGDARVGMVQARWGHLNQDRSLLTRVQAMLLDAHFSVEQAGRARMNRWFNFNGTAGIWRRACIEDAGGWSGDTLSEDVDLSYRAQLRGWRFVYRDDVVVPAELPASMSAYLTQQRRWMTGLSQVAHKLLRPIWSSRAPLATKLEASLHLLVPLAPLATVMFAGALPLAVLLGPAPHAATSLLSIGVVAAAAFYVTAPLRGGAPLARTWATVPALFALGIGIAPAVVLGIVKAWRARVPVPFERTPKDGGAATRESDGAGAAGTRSPGAWGASVSPWFALTLLGCGAGAAAAAAVAVTEGRAASTVPFVLLVAWGLSWVGSSMLTAAALRRRLTHARLA
jgi:cellulose synthase/poly-beta-1,6-N-acetylglucosamine synthase-like glycosyltransferase